MLKRTVNREEEKIKVSPKPRHQSGPLQKRTNPHASSSHVPNQIPCAVFISIIVRKLEEGLMLGPASRRAFPQLSGPARLLMLTVVRGEEGRGVIAIVIGGGIDG